MSSVIEGYNYDIFISYRQKDNKHDGWVTEFVNQLRGELEATFKEDISIYFDENPHDGLLETHSVDKSLEGKLRCLIFIPIISQTYCDSKSFAWQHEFCTFNKLAKEDQFGKDIKLAGGNVASRVLPIKIHDLDPEDKLLLENELSEFIRGIEFIYKEPGVNRPLKPEDDDKKNLNSTKYINQINKVANAVKEIINSMKKYSSHDIGISNEIVKVNVSHPKYLRIKIIIGSVLIIALIVFGYFFFRKLLKPTQQLEKSIAVLPFKLLSNEPDKQYLADGMMDAITLHLSKIKDLRVMPRTSVEQFRGTTKTMHQIGKELDVMYLLEGSLQKFGENTKLIVQLIKAREERHAWANEYNSKWSDIFSLQSEVAQTIASELHAAISLEEKQLIEKKPTSNLVAYDLFQLARDEHMKFWMGKSSIDGLNKAMLNYRQALNIDSTFAQAYSGLALGYWNKYYNQNIKGKNFVDSMKVYSDKALIYNNQLDEAYLVKGVYNDITGDYQKALMAYNRSIEINPNYSLAYNARAGLHFQKTFDIFSAFNDIFKAIQLEQGPLRPGILRGVGDAFFGFGFPENARFYYEEALKLDKDSINYFLSLANIESYQNSSISIDYCKKVLKSEPSNLAALWYSMFCYEILEQYEDAYTMALKILDIFKEKDISGLYGWDYIGLAFSKTGHIKEAKKYFDKQIVQSEKILKLDPNDDQGIMMLFQGYAALGEKEKALQMYNKIGKGHPKNIPAELQINSAVFLYYLKYDPLLDNIRNESVFQKIISDYIIGYNKDHERLKNWLEKKGMLQK